ncbi:MAG: hypothetical protein AAF802_32015 [Planctomycetota bacterium]
MKYTVVWEENATQEVAAEFVRGSDKVAIIDATYQINGALAANPVENGLALREGLYYIDRFPLRAIYSIDTEAKRVDVGRIRRIP